MLNNFTPIYSFPDGSDFHNIVIKREDLSETGSHKFRYFRDKLKLLKEQGVDRIVLSTTGNAGISAAFFAKDLGMKVICLMSDRGDMSKSAQIEKNGGILILSPRPVRFARYISKKYDIPLLRMSRDDDAVSAYESLGEELIAQVPGAQAIVNFCTSGTSGIGLMRAYKRRGLKYPALHIVQSGKSNSIAKALHPEQIPAELSGSEVGLEDTPRKLELLDLIRESGGDSRYVFRKSQNSNSKFQSDTSFEGLACLEIAEKIKDKYDSIVVIFSGKAWPVSEDKNRTIAKTFAELDDMVGAPQNNLIAEQSEC